MNINHNTLRRYGRDNAKETIIALFTLYSFKQEEKERSSLLEITNF